MTRAGNAASVEAMLGTRSFVAPLEGALARLRDWPVTAQQQARRNAMIAATACAQRRIEREEVADYLDTRAPADDLSSADTRATQETQETRAARAARRANG